MQQQDSYHSLLQHSSIPRQDVRKSQAHNFREANFSLKAKLLQGFSVWSWLHHLLRVKLSPSLFNDFSVVLALTSAKAERENKCKYINTKDTAIKPWYIFIFRCRQANCKDVEVFLCLRGVWGFCTLNALFVSVASSHCCWKWISIHFALYLKKLKKKNNYLSYSHLYVFVCTAAFLTNS